MQENFTGIDRVDKFETFYPTFERMSNVFTKAYDVIHGSAHTYERNAKQWSKHHK